jgi:hypothetical protein
MKEDPKHLYHIRQLAAYLTKTISMLEFKLLRRNYQKKIFQKGFYLLKSIVGEKLIIGKRSYSLMNQ